MELVPIVPLVLKITEDEEELRDTLCPHKRSSSVRVVASVLEFL